MSSPSNYLPKAEYALLERSLLLGSWDTSIDSSSISDLAKSCVQGHFSVVLRHSITNTVLLPDEGDLFCISETTDDIVILIFAVAALHAFIQINWTGPELDFTVGEVLNRVDLDEDEINRRAIAELALGGEPAYHLARSAMLLRVSQRLLEKADADKCPSVRWWKLRTATVHEHLLDEAVALPDSFVSDLDVLLRAYDNDPELSGRLELEKGLLQHAMGQDKLAGELFVAASRATGMEYELTGALGKRTKFQVNELSQLILLAESHLRFEEQEDDRKADSDKIDTVVPDTLLLNDDTLLEKTMFTASSPSAHSRLSHLDPGSQPALHPLDQAILLAMCLNVRNTSPVHGLTSEQMMPYVSRVISHPRNWSVHTMALLLRARLESNRTRTVERATLQLQALIEQMPTSDSDITERLRFVHDLPLPSKWEMEKELATRFLSLGATRSALEIFERLEMWEDVVKCWQSMERPDKGIAIVRDLLEGRKAESEVVLARAKTATSDGRKASMDRAREAKLWCLLGDLEPENAVVHYEKAWDISKQTAGRAMRSLGAYYFAHADFTKAMECLQKAVLINPLLPRSWFMLGCAALRLENWQEAKRAFSRCVAIDEEDGEAWSNLASMYMRLGVQDASDDSDPTASVPFENKLLAYRALKQGLKSSYENWRMWYNYVIVSMQVGELSEACRAQGRVIELKGEGSVDEDVLERLVNALTRAATQDDGETEDVSPNQGKALFRPVKHLFEDIVLPRVSSSPRVFRAYAKMLIWEGRWDDALKASLDAYRCSAAGTIEQGDDIEKWREGVTDVEEVVDALKNLGPRVEVGDSKWRGQARSIVRTFMAKTKDAFEDEPEWATLTALLDALKKREDD
ncbi:unnamed protein product [Mycena citricolor]|uniref:TPR-like protein n=1 Tax=Mycena citricolor TaxID=2018698 RepID=A0AAD2JZA1_9AGAR|nr:unnamed protein product [Mycena citricolor]